MVIYAVLFVTALLATLLLTPVVMRTAIRVDLLDAPGGRKLHPSPVPRLGGVAIALGLAAALGVSAIADAYDPTPALPDRAPLWPILAGAVLVFATGLWDDVAPLPPLLKLGGQLAAAALIVGAGILITRVTFFGAVHELGWLAVPVTVLWVLIITNALNLIDGLDGLAGGLVAIAAATCATVLIVRGEEAGARLLVALAGAAAGFLVYNMYPARIFLGDSGSLLAGFLLAVTAVTGQQKGATVLASGVPLLIFTLPLADTLLAIVRRVTAGQRRAARDGRSRVRALAEVLSPDSGHLHHLAMRAGLSHRSTVLLFYLLACVFSAMALLSMEVP